MSPTSLSHARLLLVDDDEEACRLLAETDDTVAQISLACGYATPAHFQRQFQAHQQRAPLAYRSAVRRSV